MKSRWPQTFPCQNSFSLSGSSNSKRTAQPLLAREFLTESTQKTFEISLESTNDKLNPVKDKMSGDSGNDDSLYPIAVLIDELRNEDVQVR